MNKWLLIAAVFCGWSTTSQCACAQSEAGIRASDLPARFLSSGGGLIGPEQLPAYAVHCPRRRSVNSHVIEPKVLPLPKVAELSPDDEGQADDNQPDHKDMQLACLKPSPGAAEWRLGRPDKQYANSFINSKAKPPP